MLTDKKSTILVARNSRAKDLLDYQWDDWHDEVNLTNTGERTNGLP